jgi:hypothetical protein
MSDSRVIADTWGSGRALHVTYYTGQDPRTGIAKRQGRMSGISTVSIDPSGQWLIVVDAETKQTTIRRISPDTEMIIIDRTEQ